VEIAVDEGHNIEKSSYDIGHGSKF